jgi:hypothetical protein
MDSMPERISSTAMHFFLDEKELWGFWFNRL